MSLRRLRYQLRCAAKGHDPRPYLVGGSVIEHRCLRCGALVEDIEPVVASEHGPAVPASENPLPPAEPVTSSNGGSADADAKPGDEEDDGTSNAALAALRELGELHASGVLTDKEFAAKKAQLLRRV